MMKYKAILKEYPVDWKEYTFGELFDFEGSLSVARSKLGDKGIAYLHYGDIHKRNVNYVDVGKELSSLPKYDVDDIKDKYFLENGDIVFADASEDYDDIGKAVVVFNRDNIKFIAGLHTIVAKDKSETDLNFLYKRYFLSDKSVRKQIMFYATGISVLGISKTNLRKVYVKIPSFEEQQKIADILSTWDKAIELKEQLIEQKKEQKKGLMQKLLTGEVRLSGFYGDWIEVRLGELFDERRETGYNHLELLAITSGKGVVRRTDVDIKDTSSDDKSKYKRIMPKDIGYNTMRMWQGVSGFSKYEGIVSPAYTILKPVKGIDSQFMAYLFKLPKLINIFRRYSQGLVNDTLNLKYNNLKVIKVNVPRDKKEQEALSDVFQKLDFEIEANERYVEELKLQKKGLMQLLLTGKVRVKG